MTDTAEAARDMRVGEAAYGLQPETVHRAEELLEAGDREGLRALLGDMHPADQADLIEQLGDAWQDEALAVLADDFDPELLLHISDQLRPRILKRAPVALLAKSIAELDSDDALGLVEDLDPEEQAALLRAVPDAVRRVVEEGLTWPEYSAGRLMQREIVAVPQFWTVGRTIDWLRDEQVELPDNFYELIVVNPLFRVTGTVPLAHMLRAKRGEKMQTLLSETLHTVTATADQEQVAFLFRQYGLVSLPVVTEAGGRLIGVITVDDVVDVIDEEAADDILKLGGVSEPDTYRALLQTTRARFNWLFVNVWTAFLASAVVGLFSDTLEKVVALAALMPIVAGMGGNAGTQSLTVAVRALAMKELSSANAPRVVLKEALVGVFNGLAFAAIAAAFTAIAYHDLRLSAVIAAAMVINLTVACLFGTLIPICLNKLKVDPALASSIFLTTCTDCVGFFAFLGLATLFLL